MAATAKSLPCLDLSSDPKTLERGSEEWKAMSQRVCEALETYGCLTVDYNKLSRVEQEEMLKASGSFFALPLETRAMPNPFNSTYVRMDETGTFAVYENMGVRDPAQPDKAKAFTDTMWPQGNQPFCETLNTTSKKMLELAKTIMNMICDGFELELDNESIALTEKTSVNMIRYAAPMQDEPVLGSSEHVDGTFLTILFQNEVEGLRVQTRQGDRHEVKLGGDSLIVFAGHVLRAWTNGQLYGVPHDVEFRGYKDRLSFGLFLIPKDDKIIQAHPKFVNKQHPKLFKPFLFGEFAKYLIGNNSPVDGLDVFARLDRTSSTVEA